MKSFFKKPVGIIFTAGILILIGSVFFLLSRQHETVNTATVKIANLKQEISVVGKVRPAKSVVLSFKQGGIIDDIKVSVGEKVNVGQILVEQDSTLKRRTLADAELSLQSARLEYEKIQSPIDRKIREQRIKSAIEDGLVISNSVYSNLAQIIKDLDTIFFGNDISTSENNLEFYVFTARIYDNRFTGLPLRLRGEYLNLKNQYDTAFGDYESSRAGSDEARESSIQSTYNLVKRTSEVIKSGLDVVRFYNDRSIIEGWKPNKESEIANHLSSLSSFQNFTDGKLVELLLVVNILNESGIDITTDNLSLRAQEIKILQRENDLRRAQDELADYIIRAPFGGIITSLYNIEIGQQVSSGQSAVSLISESNFEIEANVPEADIAKIKIGDSATLTLDAYGGSEVFEAVVSEIDPAETIIEGLSTYKVIFHFKTEDHRVKSGMTADILVLTDKRESVLVIPQRAVFNKDGFQAVKLLRGDGATEEVFIKTGLRGSDGYIEVLEGLEERDKVITSF